ncbi:MAG: hypothetical protein ACJ768_25530 [Gaiellaceae bacterium]
MPFTREGAERLAVALRQVDRHVEQPVTVWRWNDALGTECRATLYGWRGRGEDRLGLIVSRRWRDAAGRLTDVVEWVPATMIRARGE